MTDKYVEDGIDENEAVDKAVKQKGTLTIQVLANILMNLGLFPITGFSLPFVSYGGTNFVMNIALIGLLLGIYRRKDLVMVGVIKSHGSER